MGCCESKDGGLAGLSQIGEWPLSGWSSARLPNSSVGLLSRELQAYDFAAEAAFLDASPSVVGRPAQMVRPHSIGPHVLEKQPSASVPAKKALSVPQDYKLIQDALDAANDGDVIRIGTGRYREALVVRKRVQIIGVGRVDLTIIEPPTDLIWGATMATLHVESSEVRVCNLTLINSGNTAAVVENMCGDLTVEGCAIHGGVSGLKICESATANVRFSDISDSKAHGVFVSKQGHIAIEKSHIFRCDTGVLVTDLGSQASLVRNDVELCQQVGVMVDSSSQALFDDNNITRNGVAGVYLSAGSRGVMTSNRVSSNAQVGICIVQGSLASLKNNDLRSNGGRPLVISQSSTDLVEAESNVFDEGVTPFTRSVKDFFSSGPSNSSSKAMNGFHLEMEDSDTVPINSPDAQPTLEPELNGINHEDQDDDESKDEPPCEPEQVETPI
eukprot:CAMPEP_0184289884 /NCGR_PEP_ID=MMETSP1049-20130417/2257_1 /TAXON_ID=77928 /ORGANISM="Proteomonas sulcata, Strain CCMP704" /LENGTH=442 /DNA_ID=CAMNT_0026596863 /DNA_START=166 /DNA_END=1494 /DNA_ORIENTATION=-